VVSATDPHGRVLGFLDRNHYAAGVGKVLLLNSRRLASLQVIRCHCTSRTFYFNSNGDGWNRTRTFNRLTRAVC
jgi:hypothetical protein